MFPGPCTLPTLCLQVQVMVEVRSGRWQERRQFELLECTPDTGIADLKRQALATAAAAAAAEAAETEGAAAPTSADSRPLPGAAAWEEQELSFLGQMCEDGKCLRDYGICHAWIAQVAGFVLRPRAAR